MRLCIKLTDAVLTCCAECLLSQALSSHNRHNSLQGLLLFPGVVIIPMLEILWVLFILVSGGIYFGDFETFSKLELAMFGTGVFILLLGIFCLIPSDKGVGTCLPIPCLPRNLQCIKRPAADGAASYNKIPICRGASSRRSTESCWVWKY